MTNPSGLSDERSVEMPAESRIHARKGSSDGQPRNGPGSADSPSDDVASTFADLASRWHEETDGHSSPMRKVSNPAYLQILAMGETVLPLVLQDLRDIGGYWYPALRALSGESPVPPEAAGRPRLMKQAWLDWGRQRGYLA